MCYCLEIESRSDIRGRWLQQLCCPQLNTHSSLVFPKTDKILASHWPRTENFRQMQPARGQETGRKAITMAQPYIFYRQQDSNRWFTTISDVQNFAAPLSQTSLIWNEVSYLLCAMTSSVPTPQRSQRKHRNPDF
jgi:hypothetical protein